MWTGKRLGAGIGAGGRMDSDSIREKSLLFLDVNARIEDLCAELYHFYSRVFLDNREVSLLWKKTAMEEENHRMQIQMAMRLSDAIEDVLPDGLSVTYTMHLKLKRLVAGVKNNPPDLVTALKKAIEMEERMAFLHVESSVRFRDESIRSMFEALRGADRGHITALKRQLAIETLAFTEMDG